MITEIFILLTVYQIKHFLADFPLQGKYMMGKFKSKDWALPLAAHCGVHAFFTFIIVLLYYFYYTHHFFMWPMALGLAVFDFSVHFVVDRIKASPNLLGRYEALSKAEFIPVIKQLSFNNKAKAQLRSNTLFWWSLGADQMAHHLTNYFIIWCLL